MKSLRSHNPPDAPHARHARHARHVRHGASVALLLVAGVLAACQSRQQSIALHQSNLADAGFIVRPANTPERLSMLNRLPANQFVQRTHGGTIHYIYADPAECRCLYVGTQQAYNQFKRDQHHQHLVNEQQMAAEAYSDSAWNWGGWGPEYGFSYGPGLGW